MPRSLRAGAIWLPALLVSTLLLQGCAVLTSPGFDYAAPSNRTSVTLGQYVQLASDDSPRGVITPITASLIHTLQSAARREVPPQISKLFGSSAPYTIGPSDIISVVVYGHPELMPGSTAIVGTTTDPTGVTGAPGFIVSHDGQIFFPFIGRIKVAGLTEIEAADLIQRRLSRYIREPQVTVRIASFRSRRAYVEGEVRLPGTQVFTDIPMNLLEAINRAGGVTPNGDRSAITLTRGNETTVINLLELQELGVNPSRIVLRDGDLITVHSREESKVFVLGEVAKPTAMPMRNGRLSLNEAISVAGGPNLSTANPGQIYVFRNTETANPTLFHLNASSPTALALAEMFPLKARDIVYIDPVPMVNWNRIVSLILPSLGAANTTNRLLNQ